MNTTIIQLAVVFKCFYKNTHLSSLCCPIYRISST
nr:MAG TPA: hypothetical protein [Caudoviricetes sp.]